MAPEVFQEKYSTKADIWSVGCVVVQMVNGSPPWKCLGLTNPVSLYNHISSTTDLPYIDANGHYVSSIGRMENQSFELLQRLLEGCFQRLPEKRPSACDLLGNAFFAGDHSMSVEDLGDECKSLFSPDPTIYSRVGTSPIGANLSPIRPPTTRRNSIDASTRARFLSPPLPRSSKKKSSSLSPLMSPVRDSTNWPAWALKKILPIDQPYEATQKISLDSLVYSDDGNSVQAGYSRRSLSPGTISPIGVSFLSTHESPSSL